MCISLANQSFEECLRAVGKVKFAELRIDLLDITEEQLKTLCSIKHQTIATCRPGKYENDKRKELLKLAMDAGAGYVDIEYESTTEYREELVHYAKSCNAIVIISYHNFETTPSKEELNAIIAQSKAWGADKVKLATMANNAQDNARILSLYEEHSNIIAFCMGKQGVVTRVAAPSLGADFTFVAYSRKDATAPGQLSVGEMIDIYESMGMDY